MKKRIERIYENFLYKKKTTNLNNLKNVNIVQIEFLFQKCYQLVIAK